MAGLNLLHFVFAFLAPGQPDALHQLRLAELLEEPHATDSSWQGMLFQSASRLEHSPMAEVLPAWQALAAAGGDAELGNLILYRRRHGLPLPALDVKEGVDASLERALAAWGAQDGAAAASQLHAGLARWPSDDRYRSNLLWLERQAPASVDPHADARALAHAILAGRNALP